MSNSPYFNRILFTELVVFLLISSDLYKNQAKMYNPIELKK